MQNKKWEKGKMILNGAISMEHTGRIEMFFFVDMFKWRRKRRRGWRR